MNFEFHHFGVACRDLDRETAEYRSLGYTIEGDDFKDFTQGVHGRFLIGQDLPHQPHLPRLELLVGLDGSDVLEPWLKNGTRIYHQAFLVADFDAAIASLHAEGGRTVVAPVPAIAFDNKRITFIMRRTLSLIELIEK